MSPAEEMRQALQEERDELLERAMQELARAWGVSVEAAQLRLAGHTWGVVKSRPRNDGVTGRPFGPHEHPRGL